MFWQTSECHKNDKCLTQEYTCLLRFWKINKKKSLPKLSIKKVHCPHQEIFTLWSYRVYSHSMNLFLLTLLSMLGMFNFQEKKINCLSCSKSSNFPCSSLVWLSVAPGKKVHWIISIWFSYRGCRCWSGTFWTEWQFKLSNDIPLVLDSSGRGKWEKKCLWRTLIRKGYFYSLKSSNVHSWLKRAFSEFDRVTSVVVSEIWFH